MQAFKKIVFFFFSFLLIFNLSYSQRKPRVLATIYPLYLLVKDISCDKIIVDYILDPYTFPHGYELTPKDLWKIKTADAVVAVGCGMEDWLLKAAKSKPIFLLCEGVNLIDSNPHIWLSPRIVSERVVPLSQFLQKFYPSSCFAEKAKLLRSSLLHLLELPHRKDISVISHHNAWIYLLRDLGLKYLGSIESFSHQEPTFKRISLLLNKAKKEKKVVVIAEEGHNIKIAKLIAFRIGAKVVILNPMGSYEDKSFLDFIKRFIKGLGIY